MGTPQWFGAVLSAILVLSTVSTVARGQNGSATDRLVIGSGDDAAPSNSATALEPSAGAGYCEADGGPLSSFPRWTVSAEFIGWERVGGARQTLVSTYPPHSPIIIGTGTEVLNSSDLHQGFAGGTRLSLTRHDDCGYDMEVSYFQIDGWNSYRSIAPNVGPGPNPPPPNWLVFDAPGDFVQTTDYPDQHMAWGYRTKLYNLELNARWDLASRFTPLAGFRWINLWEDLQGTLPPERAVPFWNTTTRNNLFGFQIGEDWKIFSGGRFSLDGLLKAGIFDNHANETTDVSIYRTLYWESDSTNHLAFLGELGLQAKYQLTERIVLKAGYEAIWLKGAALAPAQIQKTFCHGTPLDDIYVQAMGIDSSSSVLFHGATAGLEWAF